MRSVRFDPELDELVRRAAAHEGASVSEFIRRAAVDRARRTLGARDRSTTCSVLCGAREGSLAVPDKRSVSCANAPRLAAMTLTDAGPLIALIDAGEPDHHRCRETLETLERPLLTTWPAFAEAISLLGQAAGWPGQDALWMMIRRGARRRHAGGARGGP